MTDTRPEQIEALFPVDGPHTTESVLAATAGWAHLARYLAHATHRTPTAAPDLYGPVTALATGAASTGQALHQLVGLIDRCAADATLRTDSLGVATDPMELALDASITTEDAANQLTEAADRLAHAADHLSRLYHHHDGPDDDEG